MIKHSRSFLFALQASLLALKFACLAFVLEHFAFFFASSSALNTRWTVSHCIGEHSTAHSTAKRNFFDFCQCHFFVKTTQLDSARRLFVRKMLKAKVLPEILSQACTDGVVGAMYAHSALPTLARCLFCSNEASHGKRLLDSEGSLLGASGAKEAQSQIISAIASNIWNSYERADEADQATLSFMLINCRVKRRNVHTASANAWTTAR
jgi:hypothetical protein